MTDKTTSNGIAAIRAQLREEIKKSEAQVQMARSKAHVDGVAYHTGMKAAYEHALALLHT